MNTKKIMKLFALSVIGVALLSLNVAYAGVSDNVRFQTKMRAADGKEFYVAVFSDDETSRINKFAGSEGAAGDVIYSGHYQFAVGTTTKNKNSDEKQISPLSEDELSFNASQTLFYVGENPFPNQPDILWVMQSGTSNNVPIRGYYLKSGKMQLLLWQSDSAQAVSFWHVKIGYRLVPFKPGCFTTTVYDNTKGSFIHRDWQLDLSTDSFVIYNTYLVPYDQEPRGAKSAY
ncbi:MAG TPA: hypothetical protein VN631_02750 [Negativicutes bacterium]|nr:hypothetical protein [Negativicutes bacterium]